LFDAQGVVTEWAGTVSDITERMQAEEALRESEERYRDLVENSRELICTHDLDGLVLSANPAAAAAVGYDLDEYVGKKTIRDLLAPEVSHQFDEYMARLRKEGATSGIMLVQTKSGERRVWDYYNSLRTEGVAAPIVRGMARDITDRVRAEESSRHYRERLEALIHSVDGIVWEADARTFQFTFVSAQAERILGFPCEQWINEPSFWHDHIHPEDRDQAVRYCVESTARKLPHEFEYRMIAQDGRAVWLRDLVTVQVEHDQPVTLRGVMLDVTARKHAEETLLASERKHRDIFTFAPVGICQSLRDGTIITANKALAEMLAYDSVDEFLKVNLADVYFTPDEREKLIREYEGPGYASDIELRWKQKDGSPIWIQLSAHVIKGSDGLTKYFEGFVRDIAERKRTELERDVISEVIQSVNLTANLDELLTHVHQSLKRVLYAENCCVALYDKQTGLFEAPLSVDLAEANPFPMTLSKNCTARVFSSGQPLLMNEAIFDELLDRGEVELIGRTAPSLLAAPLMTPGETIGVIVVQHYEKNNVYSQRDVEFLSAVAAQLALAIERKRAEEALKKSESDYRHLFNNANDAILIFESEGEIILEANAAACDVYGYSRDELIGTSLKRLTKSVLAGESQIKQLLDAGKSRNYESIQFNNKGEEIYFLINASVIDYQDRQAILSINHNITERKRQEEALRESEAMLKQSQRVAVLGHYVFDAATGFWTSSEVLDEIFGIDAAYTKNVEGWLKIVHPEQRDEIDAYLRDHVLKERNSFDREYRIVRINDGAVRWVHGLGNLEFNTEGQPARMFGVIQDITERKQAEESLRQLSGRLLHLQDEERRRIARELHDTTGQSLAALTMNLSVLGASATTLEPKARKALFQSLALAESSSREIRTLSYLLHPPLLDEVGLISAVRWYTDGFSQRSGIAVDLDITSELGRLPSDVEITLFRIVQEALTNAHHHAASKSVRIRFERISSEVSLEIKDKGHGIPPETLKSIRIGSAKIGVGIAGMRERVNQLGGRLEINSSKRGTSVTAILPVDRWNA
jgi:PAS domain S-box-containing protein